MAFEKFSVWFFEQPGLVQEAILYGPPLLVSTVITVALGGRIRLAVLSWLFNPWLAAPIDQAHREQEEADSAWTHSARASVDDLIARKRRGFH